MKFWQLCSVAGTVLMERKAHANPNQLWAQYAIWLQNFTMIVDNQDRKILDAELDADFVISVLGDTGLFCYLSADGQLRSWRFDPAAQEMSFVEIFNRYGGTVLEEVCEKGSFKVYLHESRPANSSHK
jgi:hypothetical protein